MVKKSYKVIDLLDILENKLQLIHETYEEYSVRMQEKYWLLRYFIYFLIDQGVIDSSITSKYFTSFPTDTDGNPKSELHKEYALATNYPFEMSRTMSQGRININKFYRHLLSENVALVHLGQNMDFKYL